MPSDRSRRNALLLGGSAAGTVLAGCLATDGQSDAASTGDPEETPTGNASLTDWERSTDCEDDPDRMYDSVVSVQEVASSVEDGIVPIRFSDLSGEERSILRTVTEAGGYGTCSPSDPFHRFLDRVRDRVDSQDDRTGVYLEREGSYYKLYVEFSDEVLTS